MESMIASLYLLRTSSATLRVQECANLRLGRLIAAPRTLKRDETLACPHFPRYAEVAEEEEAEEACFGIVDELRASVGMLWALSSFPQLPVYLAILLTDHQHWLFSPKRASLFSIIMNAKQWRKV